MTDLLDGATGGGTPSLPPGRARATTTPSARTESPSVLALAAIAPDLNESVVPLAANPPPRVPQKPAQPSPKIDNDLWRDIEDTLLDDIGPSGDPQSEPFFDGDPGFDPESSDNGPGDPVDFSVAPATGRHNEDEKRDAPPPSRFVRGFQKTVRLPVTLEESLFEFDIGDRALQNLCYPEMCLRPDNAEDLLKHFNEWVYDAERYDPVAIRACHTTLNARAIELLGLHMRNLRNCYDPDSEIANIILVRVVSPFCDAIRRLRSIGEGDDAEQSLAGYRQSLTDTMIAGEGVLGIIVNPKLYEDWRATIDTKARDNEETIARQNAARQKPVKKPDAASSKVEPTPLLFDFNEPPPEPLLTQPLPTVAASLDVEPVHAESETAPANPSLTLPPAAVALAPDGDDGEPSPAPKLDAKDSSAQSIDDQSRGVAAPASAQTSTPAAASPPQAPVVDLFGEVRETRRRPR